MIWNSLEDFCLSLLSALIYGMVFSLLCLLYELLLQLFKWLKFAFFASVCYSGRLISFPKLPMENSRVHSNILFEIISAFSVILFSLGLTVLSYFTLDGKIRAFSFVFSLAGYMLSHCFLTKNTKRFLYFFLKKAILAIIIILRIVTYLPRAVFLSISTKCGKKNKFMRVFGVISSYLTLDRSNL